MRKVILSMMLSVDGYIEAKKPSINWHSWDDEMADYMMGFFKTVDTFIYGRKSYEDMIAYWPTLKTDFAQIMNTTPKIVLSTTLDKVIWNARLIKKDVVEIIKTEKTKAGKDMVLFAGAATANLFIDNNLIDEYRLIVNPVLLGSGKSLFKQRDAMTILKLKNATPFKCGNVLLIYEPKI